MLDEMAFRQTAFSYVLECSRRSGGVVTRSELENFKFSDVGVPLVDRNRGIRNPRELLATISVVSKPDGPYADEELSHGRLRYDYRSGDIASGDNRKLRLAAELQLPIVLLRWIAPGVFVPVCPAYIARDVPDERHVEIVLEESLRFLSDPDSELQRR